MINSLFPINNYGPSDRLVDTYVPTHESSSPPYSLAEHALPALGASANVTESSHYSLENADKLYA